MATLSDLWNSIQGWLFPALEEELGELSEKQREFVRIWELCELEPTDGNIVVVGGKNDYAYSRHSLPRPSIIFQRHVHLLIT